MDMTRVIKGKINSSYTHLKENAFDKRKVPNRVKKREKQRTVLTQEREFQIQSSGPQPIVDKSAAVDFYRQLRSEVQFQLSSFVTL